jgi:hypothetical protein
MKFVPYNFYIQKNSKTQKYYLTDRKYVEWKPQQQPNKCNKLQDKTVQSALGDDYIII